MHRHFMWWKSVTVREECYDRMRSKEPEEGAGRKRAGRRFRQKSGRQSESVSSPFRDEKVFIRPVRIWEVRDI